ncbi:MAG: M42 family peptidase [Anaerolineales bacterium]|nr:M42 family peptidase [Chloroflexota bacterium]MBL6981927.1 M42 family peptidase [Anaerolineales bacterium]
MREIVLEQIKGHADDVQVDALGNVLATKLGKGKNRPRVLIAAHMDEVGFMIIYDDGDGLFRFDTVGGLDKRQLVGKPVWVGEDRIPGVIGAKPVHLTTSSERSRAISVDSLRIDVGPNNGGKVKVGDRATFATQFQRIGKSIRAKAIDDRIGVTTLIELIKHAPNNIDLLAAFTVQEEVGLRGARVAAYALDPDLAIALDSTPAMDLPTWDGEENIRYNTKLGLGPAIYVADGATLSDPGLIRHLRETAEAEGIPYQLRQPGGGGTDAGAIQRSREGIPVVSVSVPARYIHTAASIARIDDWRNTLSLLHSSLGTITSDLLT